MGRYCARAIAINLRYSNQGLYTDKLCIVPRILNHGNGHDGRARVRYLLRAGGVGILIFYR
jgi:hypothetical protein